MSNRWTNSADGAGSPEIEPDPPAPDGSHHVDIRLGENHVFECEDGQGACRARKRALPAVAYSHFAGAASNLFLQLPRDRRKLIQRGLQVVGYLLG